MQNNWYASCVLVSPTQVLTMEHVTTDFVNYGGDLMSPTIAVSGQNRPGQWVAAFVNNTGSFEERRVVAAQRFAVSDPHNVPSGSEGDRVLLLTLDSPITNVPLARLSRTRTPSAPEDVLITGWGTDENCVRGQSQRYGYHRSKDSHMGFGDSRVQVNTFSHSAPICSGAPRVGPVLVPSRQPLAGGGAERNGE